MSKNSSCSFENVNTIGNKTKNSRNSIVGLYIYLILKNDTDEDNTMSGKEVSALLREKYNLEAGRKTIARTLNSLEDGSLGIYCKNNRFYMSAEEMDMFLDELSEEELFARFSPKATNSVNSLAPVYVYCILTDDADETRPMSQKDIIKNLGNKYDVTLSRSAVGRHLHTLVENNIINSNNNGWYAA